MTPQPCQLAMAMFLGENVSYHSTVILSFARKGVTNISSIHSLFWTVPELSMGVE